MAKGKPRKRTLPHNEGDDVDVAAVASSSGENFYSDGGDKAIPYVYGQHTILGQFHTENEDKSVVIDALDCGGKQVTYFGMFDGHSGDENGTEASTYAAENCHYEVARAVGDFESLSEGLTEGFLETNRKFCEVAESKESDAGTCALVCLIKGRSIVVANAGDCRAVYYDGKQQTIHQLTTDHQAKVPAEKDRIERLGGYVEDGRIFGVLEPSRGFGDVEIKRAHIIRFCLEGEPDAEAGSASAAAGQPAPPKSKVTRSCPLPHSVEELRNMNNHSKHEIAARSVNDLAPEHQIVSAVPDISLWQIPEADEDYNDFLIIATDGVWGQLQNKQAVDVVSQILIDRKGKARSDKDRVQIATRTLCEAARKPPLSYDDTTAIVVWFKK